MCKVELSSSLLSPGEMTETVNPLVHLRARYYSPALGVFTALDPLETGNPYAYVGGNPINRRDPSGMQQVVCEWVWVDCDPLSINPEQIGCVPG